MMVLIFSLLVLVAMKETIEHVQHYRVRMKHLGIIYTNYIITCLLPDILRYFNSEVTGASFGTGGKDSDGAQLNRAVSAAKSE